MKKPDNVVWYWPWRSFAVGWYIESPNPFYGGNICLWLGPLSLFWYGNSVRSVEPESEIICSIDKNWSEGESV